MPINPYHTAAPPDRYRGTAPNADSVPFTFTGLISAMRYTNELERLAIPEDPQAQNAHAEAYVQQIHVARVIFEQNDLANNPRLSLPDIVDSVLQRSIPVLQATFSAVVDDKLNQFEERLRQQVANDMDKRFQQQASEINNRFKQQASDIDNRLKQQASDIDNRFKQQASDIDNRLKQQASDIDNRFKQQAGDIDNRFRQQQTQDLDKRFGQQAGNLENRLKQHTQDLDKRLRKQADGFSTTLGQRLQQQGAAFTETLDQRFEQHEQMMETRFEAVNYSLIEVRDHLSDRLDAIEKRQSEIDQGNTTDFSDMEQRVEQLRKKTDDLSRRFDEGVPERVNDRLNDLLNDMRQTQHELRALAPLVTRIHASVEDMRDNQLREVNLRLRSLDISQRLLINGSRQSGGWLEIPNANGEFPTQLENPLPAIGSTDAMGALNDFFLHRYTRFYGLEAADAVEPQNDWLLAPADRENLLSALRTYLTQPRL
ncbi:hypothetical protein RhiJN_13163 [Ceratobasidium sp. AG-Ba]|nr:hypothetical protein RhiJN_13163 [Ceratobasidium sp. AG-Ba]